ncbi:MAG: DNA-directed RNA polymerase subunit omega [Acidobacteria bacterium]|nr:DNA-directed RNA polymerase subunit omega [Acidobacteriota bacterium]
MAQTTNTPEPRGDARSSQPPITSRFLFVDVAAQRAKQLRRGALPRLESGTGPHKLERIAMEEVRTGLIDYSLPPGLESAAVRAEYQDRTHT